jgi:hypothetical protein
MEPTRSRSPSPSSRPENIQFVHLVTEMNQAERDGSLEEKIKAHKDLLKFVELGLLEGTNRAFADISLRRICKKSIDKHTAALNKPSPAGTAATSNTLPPCPAISR